MWPLFVLQVMLPMEIKTGIQFCKVYTAVGIARIIEGYFSLVTTTNAVCWFELRISKPIS